MEAVETIFCSVSEILEGLMVWEYSHWICSSNACAKFILVKSLWIKFYWFQCPFAHFLDQMLARSWFLLLEFVPSRITFVLSVCFNSKSLRRMALLVHQGPNHKSLIPRKFLKPLDCILNNLETILMAGAIFKTFSRAFLWAEKVEGCFFLLERHATLLWASLTFSFKSSFFNVNNVLVFGANDFVLMAFVFLTRYCILRSCII